MAVSKTTKRAWNIVATTGYNGEDFILILALRIFLLLITFPLSGEPMEMPDSKYPKKQKDYRNCDITHSSVTLSSPSCL